VIPDELVSRYPRLYHMAEDGSWPSIVERGLLSTAALLDLYRVSGPRREAIERQWRREKVVLDNTKLGRVVIRDQKPLPDSKLAGCLRDGLVPADWYQLLNSRVFFWMTERRLETLLHARAYRKDPQTVITVDTSILVPRYSDRIELSPINSGAVMPIATARGLSTFMALDEYPRRQAVELCIPYSVPDVLDFVISAERRTPGGGRTLLFEPS
jgi:hypothetical protein